ncbi:AfsR/SARP family transcriptional regulator [Microbispora sp. H10836]|uniref:AfsR/SARP family transcriptional regulator n=1 Tax=Microbispora sp. H10836 TaxID=2729106 RepID=UPI00147363D9|nr:AfsR/SARP family transcriptional regulator [Microbispora sp. H10836]
MQFNVLGRIGLTGDTGHPISLTRSKHLHLLALLLLRRNSPVRTDWLIDQLWNGRPPRSAGSNLKTYITQLRRLLPQGRLSTELGGYVLQAAENELDATIFEGLAAQGRHALSQGRHSSALQVFEAALKLWRGEPLQQLTCDGELAAWHDRLSEEFNMLTEDLFHVRLILGRHAEVIGELLSWTRLHPMRERPHAQLMLALHRSGRLPEALEVYNRLRRGLAEEFGVEPALAVQRLHQKILSMDAPLDGKPTAEHVLLRARPLIRFA